MTMLFVLLQHESVITLLQTCYVYKKALTGRNHEVSPMPLCRRAVLQRAPVHKMQERNADGGSFFQGAPDASITQML